MMGRAAESLGSAPRSGAEALFQIKQCHLSTNDEKGNDCGDYAYVQR
jgi:hypothetical protein